MEHETPLLSQTCGKSSKNTLLPTCHNHKHIYTPPPIKKNDETLIFEAALIYQQIAKNQKKHIQNIKKSTQQMCFKMVCFSMFILYSNLTFFVLHCTPRVRISKNNTTQHTTYSPPPTPQPSVTPTVVPTMYPSSIPSSKPSVTPSHKPTTFPSYIPTHVPTYILLTALLLFLHNFLHLKHGLSTMNKNYKMRFK